MLPRDFFCPSVKTDGKLEDLLQSRAVKF